MSELDSSVVVVVVVVCVVAVCVCICVVCICCVCVCGCDSAISRVLTLYQLTVPDSGPTSYFVMSRAMLYLLCSTVVISQVILSIRIK